jgi:hypothetical protein
MGIATLNNGGIFDWRIDPKLPDPLERALSGLRRLVAILDVGSRYLCHPAGPRPPGGVRRNFRWLAPVPFDRISAGLAARGFDEPALRAFLGANWLRTLEAVLP